MYPGWWHAMGHSPERFLYDCSKTNPVLTPQPSSPPREPHGQPSASACAGTLAKCIGLLCCLSGSRGWHGTWVSRESLVPGAASLRQPQSCRDGPEEPAACIRSHLLAFIPRGYLLMEAFHTCTLLLLAGLLQLCRWFTIPSCSPFIFSLIFASGWSTFALFLYDLQPLCPSPQQ